MASESSMSAYGMSDNTTEILDNQECKNTAVIESSATVVTETKKVTISQKFTLPNGQQNVFLAMKITKSFLDKVQQLSEH